MLLLLDSLPTPYWGSRETGRLYLKVSDRRNAMNKIENKLTVIWEEVTTPDAQERLATAFTMLFSPLPEHPSMTEQGLDSQK